MNKDTECGTVEVVRARVRERVRARSRGFGIVMRARGACTVYIFSLINALCALNTNQQGRIQPSDLSLYKISMQSLLSITHTRVRAHQGKKVCFFFPLLKITSTARSLLAQLSLLCQLSPRLAQNVCMRV